MLAIELQAGPHAIVEPDARSPRQLAFRPCDVGAVTSNIDAAGFIWKGDLFNDARTAQARYGGRNFAEADGLGSADIEDAGIELRRRPGQQKRFHGVIDVNRIAQLAPVAKHDDRLSLQSS